MAITNNGSKIVISPIPVGFVNPAIVEFTDFEYKKEVTLNVLKATVENANPATTLTNIMTNATVGINKQVTDILAGDFLATATVQAFSIIKEIALNLLPIDTGSLYTNTAMSYVCKVTILVKTL